MYCGVMGLRGESRVKPSWVSTFILLCLLPKMVKTQMEGCSIAGLELDRCLGPGKSPSIESCCGALNQAIRVGIYCLCSLLASSNSPLLSTQPSLRLSNCYLSASPLTQCPALVSVQQPLAVPVPPVLLPPDIPEQPPAVPVLPVLLPPDFPVPPPAVPVPPVLLPPDIPKRPPAVPAMPMLLPPDIPKPPPQTSAPIDFLLPTPTQEVQVPMSSTSDDNYATGLTLPMFLSNGAIPGLSVSRSGCLISNGHKRRNLLQSGLSLTLPLCACMI